eukprot:scaffold5.g671.t1
MGDQHVETHVKEDRGRRTTTNHASAASTSPTGTQRLESTTEESMTDRRGRLVGRRAEKRVSLRDSKGQLQAAYYSLSVDSAKRREAAALYIPAGACATAAAAISATAGAASGVARGGDAGDSDATPLAGTLGVAAAGSVAAADGAMDAGGAAVGFAWACGGGGGPSGGGASAGGGRSTGGKADPEEGGDGSSWWGEMRRPEEFGLPPLSEAAGPADAAGPVRPERPAPAGAGADGCPGADGAAGARALDAMLEQAQRAARRAADGELLAALRQQQALHPPRPDAQAERGQEEKGGRPRAPQAAGTERGTRARAARRFAATEAAAGCKGGARRLGVLCRGDSANARQPGPPASPSWARGPPALGA